MKPTEKPREKPTDPTVKDPIEEPAVDDEVAVIADEYRVYKTIYSGRYTLPVMIGDRKKYLPFTSHSYRTKDPKEIDALESIVAEDNGKPVKDRRVLTQDEFLELTSPESMLVEIDGERVHISDIREAVRVAKKNGWKPTGKQKFILTTKSKISQGSRTASAGGI